MSSPIEDYALLGNGRTAALVSRAGSIDWLGFPRFDSAAFFAALLGDRMNGRWAIAPVAENPLVHRSYRSDTLVLETEFVTPEGAVLVIDCMDHSEYGPSLVRLVRGLRGRVPMRMELVIRFEYGKIVPWVTRRSKRQLEAVAGAEQLVVNSGVPFRGEGMTTVAEFTAVSGDEIPFSLSWSQSWQRPPEPPDARTVAERVSRHWRRWSERYSPQGEWREAVVRSLITLKALTHDETGGILAAATTSLPEHPGGTRNWDYRFCWLRDSTFTLYALLSSDYVEEARTWRNWLLRAVAGSPDQLQIMYGLAGERRLTEYQIPWLGGYEGSKPVRIGNAASEQVQLDV